MITKKNSDNYIKIIYTKHLAEDQKQVVQIRGQVVSGHKHMCFKVLLKGFVKVLDSRLVTEPLDSGHGM